MIDTSAKPELRKRQVVGWRQVARRIAENRARQRARPPQVPKRER